MKVAITGATGFLGKSLALSYLKRGANYIYMLDRL